MIIKKIAIHFVKIIFIKNSVNNIKLLKSRQFFVGKTIFMTKNQFAQQMLFIREQPTISLGLAIFDSRKC